MEELIRLAILECCKEEREVVVLSTLDAACRRFDYYLGKFRKLIIKEIDEVIDAKQGMSDSGF